MIGDAGFSAFGEVRDPRTRAEMLDEALEVVAGLLSGESFSFTGKHYSVDHVDFQPAPLQEPRVRSGSVAVIPTQDQRPVPCAGDGSCLYHAQTHDLQAEDIRQLRERAGDRRFDICAGGRERRDGDRDWLADIAAAGATWWAEYVPAQDRPTMRAAVRRGPLLSPRSP